MLSFLFAQMNVQIIVDLIEFSVDKILFTDLSEELPELQNPPGLTKTMEYRHHQKRPPRHGHSYQGFGQAQLDVMLPSNASGWFGKGFLLKCNLSSEKDSLGLCLADSVLSYSVLSDNNVISSETPYRHKPN